MPSRLKFTSTVSFTETKANSRTYNFRGTNFICKEAEIKFLRGFTQLASDNRYYFSFDLEASTGTMEAVSGECDARPFEEGSRTELVAADSDYNSYHIEINTLDGELVSGGIGKPEHWESKLEFTIVSRG